MRSTINGRIVVAALLPLLVLVVVFAAGHIPASQADGDPEALQPIHWRVVFTETPQHELLIAWDTRAAGTTHAVCFDTQARQGQLKSYATRLDAQRNGRYSDRRPELHYHHAALTGLKPATTYWFTLVSDDQTSREFHVTTAPAEDKDFRLLSGGDSRSDPDRRRQMNKRMAAMLKADKDLLALAHGGDYVVNGGDLGLWDQWLSDHELTTTDDGRVLPIIPTRGNHEASGKLYDEVFGWPGGGLGKNWFATKVTPQVLLVTLNTETSTSGSQAEFLNEELKRNTHIRWQMAQYHRPAWPAVKRPSSATVWVRSFERFNVDLVLESDGHALKRTVPIRNDKQADDGVVYIGEGGLGVGQRTPDTDRWFLKSPGMATSGHHVWLLSFSKSRLQVQAIDINGNTVDDHSLTARERVDEGEDF